MKKNVIVRAFFVVLGFISLGLGIVGIVLPILPTVPFFLFTLFCFARGSKKFETWFINSKLYKKYLQNFVKHKTMSVYGELGLLAFVSVMILLTMFLVNNIYANIVLLILIIIKYVYFIFKIKTVSLDEYRALRKEEKND